MNSKDTIFKIVLFLFFIMLPSPLFAETEYSKEVNKCRYSLEDCCKVCLKKEIDANTKPARSKVGECVRECDFYDNLCKKIAKKLFHNKN